MDLSMYLSPPPLTAGLNHLAVEQSCGQIDKIILVVREPPPPNFKKHWSGG